MVTPKGIGYSSKRMLPLFRAVVKFCSTNRLFRVFFLLSACSPCQNCGGNKCFFFNVLEGDCFASNVCVHARSNKENKYVQLFLSRFKSSNVDESR